MKGRYDDEMLTCGKAFDSWAAGDPEREGLFGRFSQGWFDALRGRSDIRRREMFGVDREVYMAGRWAYSRSRRQA